MSDVQRYAPGINTRYPDSMHHSVIMQGDDAGKWVRFSDYETLRARVAELEAALAKREAVELPAALVVTAEGSHHDYYAEGWNDCRRKVRELAASQQSAKGDV